VLSQGKLLAIMTFGALFLVGIRSRG